MCAQIEDLPGAILHASRAVELITSAGAPEEIIDIFQGHLEILQSGKAIRE